MIDGQKSHSGSNLEPEKSWNDVCNKHIIPIRKVPKNKRAETKSSIIESAV